jgi:dipeptidyl-peptidase-4
MLMKKAMTVLGLMLAVGFGWAQEELTIDWIHSDGGKNAAAMPDFFWTAAGDLLLLDGTVPEDERAIERLIPATGERKAAVDGAAALVSLEKLLGDEATPEALPWPVNFDEAGSRALYEFGGDLYVLELAAAVFRRVTSTPELEQDARISPDGNWVAFVRANDLCVVDLETGSERRLTDDGSETLLNGTLSYVYYEEVFDRGTIGYWWSPDSSAIVFLKTDESMVTELLWLDHKPAVPRVIRQRYPKAGGVNPQVRVGIADVATGSTVVVDREKMRYEYVVRLAWTPDSSQIAIQVVNRQQTRLDLHLVDAETGEPTRILSDPDEAWVNFHEIEFLADGSFVWSSERDGYTRLYLCGADGTPIRRLTSGDWSVRGPGSFYSEALDSTWVDEDAGVVFFTAREASPIELQLYRVGLDGQGFERITPERGTHLVDFSPDRRFFADLHSANCVPPTLVVRGASGERLAVVATSRPGLFEDLDWVCPELVTVPADDGTPLQVRLLKPQPFDPAKSHPAVLYVYGGPSAPVVEDSFSTRLDRSGYDQLLARAGFVVMSVDPRSATGASKTDQNTVAGRVWSDGELADMLAGVRWLKTHDWVDGDRVGVWGWSGGGTSTLLLMTRSEEFKAGVAVAAATNWEYYDTKFSELYMRTPADNPEGYENHNLIDRAKDIHGRVLLVTGTYDDNVHPQHTYAVIDELIEAGKEFDVMIYPMRKHSIVDTAARIDLYKRMMEFWQRNLAN